MHTTTRPFTRLGLYLTLASAASAQVTLDLETTTYIPAVSTVAQDTANPSSAASPSASVATAYGSASASSSLGVMHLSATSTSTVINGYGDTLTTSTLARATWNDTILVTAAAPELNGTQGRLHARFVVSGSLNVPSVASTFSGAQPGDARWQVQAGPAYNFGGEGSVGGNRSLYIDHDPNPPYGTFSVLSGDTNFQTYDLYIPFTFGDSFGLEIKGNVGATAQPRGMGLGNGLTTVSDLTFIWLGISETTDVSDSLLSGITIQSSGDWLTTSAVPEPSTYALLAGVAALGVATWRRRRLAV